MTDYWTPTKKAAAAVFGRVAEEHHLNGMIGETLTGSGRGILIEGDAGIGKTTLIEGAAEHARNAGFRVLRCTGLQNALPSGFDALHELLHPLLPLAEALPARQRSALLTAFALADGDSPDRLLVGLAALGLLEEAATTGPIFIAVEDLQWIDASSAEAINFVCLRLSMSPIMLVATFRTSPDTDHLRPRGLERITLGPVDESAAAAILGNASGALTPLARKRILDEAGGNPLALCELPAALKELGIEHTSLYQRLPTTKRLENAYLDQLVNIPLQSRQMLVLAAASDDGNLQDIVSAARRIGLAVDDLHPVEAAGLVTLIGESLKFRHPLLRSAVQSAASTKDWMNAHLALAEVIPDRSRKAWHRAAAAVERDESVAAELDVAAQKARQRGAQPEAARAYKRAATLSENQRERTRRLSLAAETSRSAGHSFEALELLDEVGSIAEPETLAEAAVTRIILSLTVGLGGQSRAELDQTIAVLSARPEDLSRKVKVLWGAAFNARGRNLPLTEWRRIEDELRALDTNDPLKAIALAALAPLGSGFGLRSGLPELVPQLTDFPLGMISLAIAAESLQDLETALTCWGLSSEGFHARGAAADQTQSLRGRANVFLLRGRLKEGLADAEYARRMAKDTGQLLMQNLAVSTIARAQALLGDYPAARVALDEANELSNSRSLSVASADARWASGLIALGEQRNRDALIEFTHMTVHPTRSLWAIADRTEAAVRSGRADFVRENVAEADVAARSYRSSYLTALVERSKALLADLEEAGAHYERALQAGRLSESPLELARTQLLFGEWLRRERRSVEARLHLRDALQEFDSIGAQVFANRAASELRAAGGAPDRKADAAVSAAERLTPQELQVARLAAQGLSNKEIADRIYLSHRTVSTHLYKVFPKLAITGRAQLHKALAQAGYEN